MFLTAEENPFQQGFSCSRVCVATKEYDEAGNVLQVGVYRMIERISARNMLYLRTYWEWVATENVLQQKKILLQGTFCSKECVAAENTMEQ